jgi:hypothetical protein
MIIHHHMVRRRACLKLQRAPVSLNYLAWSVHRSSPDLTLIVRNLARILHRVGVGYDAPPLRAQRECDAWCDTFHTPRRLTCATRLSARKPYNPIPFSVGFGERSKGVRKRYDRSPAFAPEQRTHTATGRIQEMWEGGMWNGRENQNDARVA